MSEIPTPETDAACTGLTDEDDAQDYERVARSLERRLSVAVEALHTFGHHLAACAFVEALDQAVPCDCGFDEALRRIAELKEKGTK